MPSLPLVPDWRWRAPSTQARATSVAGAGSIACPRPNLTAPGFHARRPHLGRKWKTTPALVAGWMSTSCKHQMPIALHRQLGSSIFSCRISTINGAEALLDLHRWCQPSLKPMATCRNAQRTIPWQYPGIQVQQAIGCSSDSWWPLMKKSVFLKECQRPTVQGTNVWNPQADDSLTITQGSNATPRQPAKNESQLWSPTQNYARLPIFRIFHGVRSVTHQNLLRGRYPVFLRKPCARLLRALWRLSAKLPPGPGNGHILRVWVFGGVVFVPQRRKVSLGSSRKPVRCAATSSFTCLWDTILIGRGKDNIMDGILDW